MIDHLVTVDDEGQISLHGICATAGLGGQPYHDELDTSYIIRDNTILMMPHGYHTVVNAPGYTTYYLWCLAGHHRIQATVDDPAVGWVGRTVPMLKELGH